MDLEGLNAEIEKIAGDKEKISCMISAYKPFIAACTKKVTGRFLRFGEDDELSVAMLAFEKAIRYYSPERGNFLKFAEKLIKNSVVDYLRKEKKHSALLYVDKCREEKAENEVDLIDRKRAIDVYNEHEEIKTRKMEVLDLKNELAALGISFSDLENASPKSKKTKEICNKIIYMLMNNEVLRADVLRTGKIPLKAIEASTGIKRKKFERHRKYIIAVIFILQGEYRMIREYIDKDLRIKCWGCKD